MYIIRTLVKRYIYIYAVRVAGWDTGCECMSVVTPIMCGCVGFPRAGALCRFASS